MQDMPARKGVPMRSPDPDRVKTLVELDPDVRAVLDRLKVVLNQPLAVVVEEFIRNAPKDEVTGLPVWVVNRVDAEQLPLTVDTTPMDVAA